MSNKIKIAILGGTGLLGKPLTDFFKKNNYDVITISRNSSDADYNIDVNNAQKLLEAFYNFQPNLIINLVAITSVDLCESNIPLAYKVHVKLNEVLADYSIQTKTKILYISTDHFYEGNGSKELDLYPQNVYGLTKLMGENVLLRCDSVILRTNFFGYSQTQNRFSLTDIMYNNAKNGIEIKLFDDVYFSPLSIKSLCSCIMHVVEYWKNGIYNVGSKNGMSKADFVIHFLKATGFKNISFERMSIKDSHLTVNRPKDMRMNVELFENTYCYELPSLVDEIDLVAGDYNEKKI